MALLCTDSFLHNNFSLLKDNSIGRKEAQACTKFNISLGITLSRTFASLNWNVGAALKLQKRLKVLSLSKTSFQHHRSSSSSERYHVECHLRSHFPQCVCVCFFQISSLQTSSFHSKLISLHFFSLKMDSNFQRIIIRSSVVFHQNSGFS